MLVSERNARRMNNVVNLYFSPNIVEMIDWKSIKRMIHVILVGLIREVECWTCNNLCSETPWRWHSSAETCRGDIYNKLCFMMCILLRAFVCHYTDPLSGDEPSSNWLRPTSITVCQQIRPCSNVRQPQRSEARPQLWRGVKEWIIPSDMRRNFYDCLFWSGKPAWRSLG